MEDALALSQLQRFGYNVVVLILVLMEDALAHFLSLIATLKRYIVLILVLMEDALAQQN